MKCIIVDDEFPSREELKYFIDKYSSIQVQDEFDNGVDALKFITENKIDVIFLDINMPLLDGMEFSKILYKNNKDIKVVFITAYKEHAVEAFEVHAFDYLLKPYSEERIISALNRLEKSEERNRGIHNKNIERGNSKENKSSVISDKLSVLKDDKIFVIDTSEIYYIEAHGRGVEVYTKNIKYYSKNKISDIRLRLMEEG